MNEAILNTPIGDLNHISDWIELWGGENDDLPLVVQEMHSNNLTWKDIEPYRLVCYDVTAIRECIDNGLDADQLATVIDGTSLGYMVSNHDITASEARQLWEDSL